MKPLGRILKILSLLAFALWLVSVFWLQLDGLELLTGWGRFAVVLLGLALLLLPVIGWSGLVYAGVLALNVSKGGSLPFALALQIVPPFVLAAIFLIGDWLDLEQPGRKHTPPAPRGSDQAPPHSRSRAT